MLSIIIPTLNEENYLPRLLESLRRQSFRDFEVIVADAGSKDTTREIAKAFGCKVVKGGLPAKGRNQGAKEAKGDLLLFLDADVILPEDFLTKAIGEFKKRDLDIASFPLIPISEKRNSLSQILFDFFYNYPLKIFEKKWPHGAMGILVKKSLHQNLKGFDEEIKFAEDHDYIKRASELRKFGVIKSTKIFVSLRRFKKEGWVKVGFKYAFAEIYRKLKGPIRKEIFQYKFNHYDEEN
ncbi:glycosyltransferase [bacterium]|nr:glycosyltransferase [bacterium]